jgi:hypothetical protein
VLVASFLAVARAAAAPVHWPVATGGNGHFYEFVPAPQMTWDDARSAAQRRTLGATSGHLATLTSQGEWDFAVHSSGFDVVRGEAWIGGAQPGGSATPSAGWFWVTGEPFAYAPWGRYFIQYPEPNDLGGPARPAEDGSENYLALFGTDYARGIGGNPNYGLFNDEGGVAYIEGYIAEYPVPEPHALPLAAAAGLLALRRRSRRRSAREHLP